MPPVGFEPTISAGERPKTYALDRAATGTGNFIYYYRIKTNQEINYILKRHNIIGFIKKQRLNWSGHVERMAEDNNVQKIKRWKPMSKRRIGRPKTRWEDDILEDITNMNVRNWKEVAQDRDSWKRTVERARTVHRE